MHGDVYCLCCAQGRISSSSSSASGSSDSDADSDSSSSSESLHFDDGLGDDLVGDKDDREKLERMTEAEREVELFKRCA